MQAPYSSLSQVRETTATTKTRDNTFFKTIFVLNDCSKIQKHDPFLIRTSFSLCLFMLHPHYVEVRGQGQLLDDTQGTCKHSVIELNGKILT